MPGLCSGNNESAGKRKNGRNAVRNHPFKTILVQAAWAAIKKRSYYKTKYYKLKARRGARKAIVAIAHKITLDKATPGGDHGHSADPDDLKELKRRIHLFKEMKGSKDALYSRPDRNCTKDFRRGVYALKELNKGDIISEADLFCTRPVSEFTPDDIEKLTGKTVIKHIPANNPISKNCIE